MLTWLNRFQRRRVEPTALPGPPFLDERNAALRGDFDRAVDGYFHAYEDMARRGEVPALIGRPRVAAFLLNHHGRSQMADDAIRIEAAATLAEDLVNSDTNFDAALVALQYKARLQDAWRARHGSTGRLYLGEDWTRNIGHIASIQHLLMLQRLGLASWQRIVVVARRSQVANLALLQQFGAELDIVTDPKEVARLAPRVAGDGLRFFDLLGWKDHQPVAIAELGNFVESLWAANRQPICRLDPSDLDYGRDAMARIGLPADASFVCFHVREDGYHNDKGYSARSSSIESYLPAMQRIVDEGHWVVRLGDPSMSPLPRRDRVIDYANCGHRDPLVDVYLCAQCHFFVGTTSGLMFVPHLFGVPALITNYMFVFAAPPLGRTSRFLPQLVRQQGRDLNFAEMMSARTMRACYSNHGAADLGLSFVANSPDEIDDAVREMSILHPPPDVRRRLADDCADEIPAMAGSLGFLNPPSDFQRRFQALYPAAHRNGNAMIGRDFVDQHQRLLP